MKKDKKEKFEKASEKMTTWIVDNFNCAFRVKKESDGSGVHMSVYLEEQGNLREKVPELPVTWMGWRLVYIKCPTGYIAGVSES